MSSSPIRASVARLAGLSLVFLPLLLAPAALASDINGFLPGAGKGAVAFGFTDESYDEFWVGEEKTSSPNLGEISTQSTTLWATWGFTDRLALIADIAYVDTEAGDPAGLSDSGLQNLTVLLAHRLLTRESAGREHSLTAAVGLRTPLESYEPNAPVARGDETTDGLLRLVYMLRSGRFYYSQQVGFDLRGDDAPDGVPIYTELGWSAGRLTWIATYSRYFADGGSDIGQPGFTFPGLQEELERVGAKVVGRVDDHWSVFLAGFLTLDGRNTGDADGLSLGLVHRF